MPNYKSINSFHSRKAQNSGTQSAADKRQRWSWHFKGFLAFLLPKPSVLGKPSAPTHWVGFYVMDFVAFRKAANPTGTKASSWLERMWFV